MFLENSPFKPTTYEAAPMASVNRFPGLFKKIFQPRSTRVVKPLRGLTFEMLESRVVPSFAGARNFNVGNTQQQVVVGDFNNDGNPDMVVSYRGGGLGIMFGHGDGT